ncbi:MAG: HEAT repeat domain-containing protein [Acidimicrobiales bacterium]
MSVPGAERLRVAAMAGHTADRGAARRALQDRSGQVRATALGALGRMGALLPEDLLGAMSDPDPGVRRRSCELAGQYRFAVAVDGLLRCLSDRSAVVVEAACWSLGEVGQASPGEAVGALAALAAAHTEPLCREAAVAALGALGAPEGLPAVLAALQDKPAVRRRAVVALAAFEGEQVVSALAGAARDRDWQVRQAAEDLLGSRPRQ